MFLRHKKPKVLKVESMEIFYKQRDKKVIENLSIGKINW